MKSKKNSHLIELTECIVYLGVFIDSRLAWKEHINFVLTKLEKV